MGQIKTQPVEIVTDITAEEFVEKYYKPRKPVLIKNLTKDWPAVKKWNLDYIQERAGEQIVPLYDSKPVGGKKTSHAPAQKMKLYDYIELLKSGPTDLRMFFYNVLSKMPELTKDFDYPEIGMPFFKKLPVMFFGGAGSKVLTHYDMDVAHNMHFHFHGHKRVMLFEPEQTRYLYKIPFSVHNHESIDMDDVDFDIYPMLQNAVATEAFMEHGDALYMPSGYWHYIKYLDAGFSLTLRSFPRHGKGVAKLLSNLVVMRNFENLMRKIMGQKWVDYKDELAVRRTNKKYAEEI